MDHPGNLFVVAAPSGSGKSSLVNALLEVDAGVAPSISHTTRAPRGQEKDGREYFFIDDQAFDAKIAAGDFLEWALVHGNRYGTSRQAIEARIAAGGDVVLEIDWQGARQVREKVPDAVSVFILPPSRQALEQRMRARGQDSEEVIQRRLAAAREEMSHYREFDYVIVNDVFEEAVAQMHAIFTASRLRREAQDVRHAGLIAALLAD